MADVKAQFESAVAAVKKLANDPGNEAKLELYALYKQSTEGDAQGKRPGFTDFVGRAKYDAWAAVKGLSKEQAMGKYIELCHTLGA